MDAWLVWFPQSLAQHCHQFGYHTFVWHTLNSPPGVASKAGGNGINESQFEQHHHSRCRWTRGGSLWHLETSGYFWSSEGLASTTSMFPRFSKYITLGSEKAEQNQWLCLCFRCPGPSKGHHRRQKKEASRTVHKLGSGSPILRFVF